MLGSIYSGITGLRNFQDQLDIVANNIANVNTVGYKGSRATFQTLLFQNLRSGMAPQNQLGGINPMQIGAGSQLASIDKIMTQGSPMATGKATDLMIQGEGFFILSDGTDQYYTRAGNFTRDYNGFFLEPATGMKLQGWTAKLDDEGNMIIDTNEPIGDIRVSSDQVMAAKQTSFARLANNLNAGVGIQDTTIVVKSTTGENIPIKFSFNRDMSEANKNKNVYNWTASVVGSDYKFALLDSSNVLTSTNEITGKVELDNTGNVINWVNYDKDGVPIDDSKISIFDINGEIVDKYGDSVSLGASVPVSAQLEGSISVVDKDNKVVYYDPTSTKVSFIDTDNDGNADQVKVTLTTEDGTNLTFTKDEKDFGTEPTDGKISIEEFNKLITAGIKDQTNSYTLTGLQLSGETDSDVITVQTFSGLKSGIVPVPIDITTPDGEVSATLEGSISMIDESGNLVYFPPENIKVYFKDTNSDNKADQVEIILKDSDGTELTFTGTMDGNTINDFRTLITSGGLTATVGDKTYTLRGLEIKGGVDSDIINDQGPLDVQSVGVPEPVSAEANASVVATLTGSIKVIDKETGASVYYDLQNINISFVDKDNDGIADQVEISLTKEDGTTLTFAADDADGFTIGDFNELLLTTGITDTTNAYTLTGLQLTGGTDTDIIRDQTFSGVESAVSAPVSAVVDSKVSANFTGTIEVTDSDSLSVSYKPESVNISFYDKDNDGDADQVVITLTTNDDPPLDLTFTAQDANGFTIDEFNNLLDKNTGSGITGTDPYNNTYTLKGLKLEGDSSDTIRVQDPLDLKSTVVSTTVNTSAGPDSAELGGNIIMTDDSENLVFYPLKNLDISFIDTDIPFDNKANQIEIRLTTEDGTNLTFTKDEKDFAIGPADGKISIEEFNALLTTGITDTTSIYTLTGLQLTGGTDSDTIDAQNVSTTVDPVSADTFTFTPVPSTLTGSITATDNGTEENVYYDPQDIDISFIDTDNDGDADQVEITLTKQDGSTLTFTANGSEFGSNDGKITIEEFNHLMSNSGITSDGYTLKGLRLEGDESAIISGQDHLNVKSSVSIPAAAEPFRSISATLTGSIGVKDNTTGETVHYDPENIDIKFEGTEVSITLTKKDGTTLTFTKDATSFGNNDAEISIEEFNDLLSEGIVDESGTYTLTGLRLVGDSDTYTINNQTLSDLKSVREVIQPPLGGAIRFTDLNNPTNFSEAEYVNPSVTTSTVVYDSLGNPYNVYLRFSKIDANTWYWKAELEDGHPLFKIGSDGQLLEDHAEGVIAFDANGNIAATQWKINPDGTIDQDLKDGDNGAAGFWFDPAKVGAALNDEVDPESAAAAGPVNVSINFQELTQFFAENSIAVTEQDGNAQGTLESFAIDNNGLIIGSFTNGLAAPLGQIALATFNNPEGLSATGNSMYAMSPNSGTPQIGISGVGGKGSINSGALEMSNVDLAEEFTNMIIAQRGFQANSRSITTADAILNEIINIKR